MSKSRPIVETVIEQLGGVTKAASALGIDNPSVIANWRTRGRVPVEWVIRVEAASGISRHELRPDLSSIFISSEPAPSADMARAS